jgi:hypothetical protein
MSEMFIAALGITAFGGHKDRTSSKYTVAKALVVNVENARR